MCPLLAWRTPCPATRRSACRKRTELLYFKDEHTTKPKGCIPLAGVCFVDPAASDETERGHRNVFRLVPRKPGARTYVLKASSRQAKTMWCSQINENLEAYRDKRNCTEHEMQRGSALAALGRKRRRRSERRKRRKDDGSFATGEVVESNYGKFSPDGGIIPDPTQPWYRGVVTWARPDGTYDIHYDDGSNATRVRQELIRAPQGDRSPSPQAHPRLRQVRPLPSICPMAVPAIHPCSGPSLVIAGPPAAHSAIARPSLAHCRPLRHPFSAAFAGVAGFGGRGRASRTSSDRDEEGAAGFGGRAATVSDVGEPLPVVGEAHAAAAKLAKADPLLGRPPRRRRPVRCG